MMSKFWGGSSIPGQFSQWLVKLTIDNPPMKILDMFSLRFLQGVDVTKNRPQTLWLSPFEPSFLEQRVKTTPTAADCLQTSESVASGHGRRIRVR